MGVAVIFVICQTRIVRESDYSPAAELFNQVQDFSNINELGIKFDLAVKKRSRSTQIRHLCIPGMAHIPNATFQVPTPLTF